MCGCHGNKKAKGKNKGHVLLVQTLCLISETVFTGETDGWIRVYVRSRRQAEAPEREDGRSEMQEYF